MIDYVWLIPLFPLMGFLINGLFGSRFKQSQIGAIASAAIGLSFIVSVTIFFQVLQLPASERSISKTIYTWIRTGDFQVDISFLIDPLSLVMLLVVTGVGLLIHVYSIGYMHGDRSFARYFAYLNLFTFSMLLLVLADNFLLLFVGWEGVGLCSYLLIGFFDVAVTVLASMLIFQTPMNGSVGLLAMMTLLFLVGALALGIFISAAVKSQVLATQIAMVATYLPAVLLSGFLFDIASMPRALQGVTLLIPARYFVTVTRGIFLKGVGLSVLWPQALFMLVYALLGLALATRAFKKELQA